MQVQNNSALGVEVNSEAIMDSMLRNFEIFGCSTLGMIY